MKKLLSVLLSFGLVTIVIAQINYEQYLVNTKTLNLRSGAGTEFEIITQLSMGDVVTVIEKYNKDWWYVDFEETQGYISSSLLKKDPYSDWQKKSYETGTTPDCENIIPRFDYKLDNYLKVDVNKTTDVIVKLMKIGINDECIRIFYVRGGEYFETKNIPEGEYYLKIAYGRDIRQKIDNNQCYIKFMKNAIYQIGTETFDFNKVKLPNKRIGNNIYENWDIPSYEISLGVTITKGTSFNTNTISETEFNK